MCRHASRYLSRGKERLALHHVRVYIEIIPNRSSPPAILLRNTAGALYTTTFVMAMNKAKYDSLAPDLKKINDANSGMATSAWLGKTQQGNDPAGRKPAVDRGNTIYQFTAAQREEFVKLSSNNDEDWVADMDKRGFEEGQGAA